MGLSADPCNQQLWYAWQRAGRTSAINFDGSRSRPSNFPQRGAGGRVSARSLQSVVALLVCMPADREEKPAELFNFVFLRFRRSKFPEREAKGGAFVGFLSGQEGKSALIYLSGFETVRILQSGGRGVVRLEGPYTRRRRFWYALQRVERASVLAFLVLAFAVQITWSEGRGVGFPVDLHNRWWRLWYAYKRFGRASVLISLFSSSTVRILQSGGLG